MFHQSMRVSALSPQQARDAVKHEISHTSGLYVGGAAVAAMAVVAILFFAFAIYLIIKSLIWPKISAVHDHKEAEDSPNSDSIHIQSQSTISFSHEELLKITQGFSPQHFLGEGGYGVVYRGYIASGKPVAVKQLKPGSKQGEKEFKAEVEIISTIHHRNLVSLVGYCTDKMHRTLVYEYVPNKTLEEHLHDARLPPLKWSARMKIARGAARGLEYLHKYCQPQVIHRDIKSANILLDKSFNAKVADFGLAKLINDEEVYLTTIVKGTNGYIAPEYAGSGRLTDKADIYSFGILLLEIVTGRKAMDRSKPSGEDWLAEWVFPLAKVAIKTGDFSEIVDRRLPDYDPAEMTQMVTVGLNCIERFSIMRPSMVEVVAELCGESETWEQRFGCPDSLDLEILPKSETGEQRSGSTVYLDLETLPDNDIESGRPMSPPKTSRDQLA